MLLVLGMVRAEAAIHARGLDVKPRAGEVDEEAPPVPVDPNATKTMRITDAKEPEVITNPFPASNGVLVQWFGHAFVYLTSQSGIRIAIDPFTENVHLPFPKNLAADVVLISYESLDRSGGERLAGSPQIFRSITGLGVNRASGILFHGVETYHDARGGQDWSRNIAYVFNLDGIRFCHLGAIGHTLTSSQAEEIGHVDVLFLPVGNKDMSIDDLKNIVQTLHPHWVVPIDYKDEKAGFDNLRSVDEFASEYEAVKTMDSDQYIFHANELPPSTIVLLLKSPSS